MSNENPFQRLRNDLTPSSDAKGRVRNQFESKMRTPFLMREVSASLQPSPALKKKIWSHIAHSLQPSAATVLERVRGLLTPPDELVSLLRSRLLPQLAPVPHVLRSQRRMKWVASFAVVALAVRLVPQLIMAPQGIAESFVTLVPTRGEVSVFVNQYWTSVDEPMVLQPGMTIRTQDGEASIVFHDDGVIRLGPLTALELHDTTDRLQQSDFSLSTATLLTGRLWVQGLVSTHLAGLSVDTSFGVVTVRDGSVSIEKNDLVDVRVYSRRATVLHEGHRATLVQGERTQMWDGNILSVAKFAQKSFTDEWPDQNLARDAVHRRDIAQLQHERRIARAGILPTSRLYQVKRVAEKMDVLMTIGEDARMEKILQQADTRLSEAAALIAQGDSEQSTVPLQEFKNTLVAVAAGTGTNSLTPFLLQQSLTETTAGVAAMLPGDEGYALKKAVLEVSTTLPEAIASDEAHEVLLTDTLVALGNALKAEDMVTLSLQWKDVQMHLGELDQSSLSDEDRKEIHAQLQTFAVALSEHNDPTVIDADITTSIQSYLPPSPEPVIVSMTDQEVLDMVRVIYRRIFLYTMEQPRINQFNKELQSLYGHPEQGRILRKMEQELPSGPERFPDRIKREILRLRWEKAGEQS